VAKAFRVHSTLEGAPFKLRLGGVFLADHIRTVYRTPVRWVPHLWQVLISLASSNGGCPISRVLCEKWDCFLSCLPSDHSACLPSHPVPRLRHVLPSRLSFRAKRGICCCLDTNERVLFLSHDCAHQQHRRPAHEVTTNGGSRAGVRSSPQVPRSLKSDEPDPPSIRTASSTTLGQRQSPCKPQSGERIKPTAQAVGAEHIINTSPSGAQEQRIKE